MFPDNREGQFSGSGENQVNESGIFRKGNDIPEYQIQKTHLDMLKVCFSFKPSPVILDINQSVHIW